MDLPVCISCSGPVDIVVLDQVRDYEYGVDWEGHIHACSHCGLAQQVPMPTARDALRFYPENYVHYQASPARGLRSVLMKLYTRRILARLRKLGVQPGQSLLDVGCGGGEKLALLRDGLQLKVIGVEPNAQAANNAREQFGLEVKTGFFPTPDLNPDSFDFVQINHVIEHVPNPVGLLEEIFRVLKPGGWVIGETENMDCLSFRLFGRYWSFLHTPFHLSFFTPKTLDGVFRRSSFKTCQTVSQTDPSAWSLSLQNRLRRHLPPGQPRGARIPGYLLISVASVPVSWVERGSGPVLAFSARKQIAGSTGSH
ncbi:MAG: class I SAM-dependent methyltransferase [Magnetococcales bacterium]|nr:class I SAM-dependent methyltransferase [Magnetococcales bacterium]MBF0150722.1 class I SAM-dependent methyltransferase [Magnetococcales bacterium]MBF0631676.1 class I SAM-dependent methyltransferase [Magnetococcales bacterium]